MTEIDFIDRNSERDIINKKLQRCYDFIEQRFNYISRRARYHDKYFIVSVFYSEDVLLSNEDISKFILKVDSLVYLKKLLQTKRSPYSDRLDWMFGISSSSGSHKIVSFLLELGVKPQRIDFRTPHNCYRDVYMALQIPYIDDFFYIESGIYANDDEIITAELLLKAIPQDDRKSLWGLLRKLMDYNIKSHTKYHREIELLLKYIPFNTVEHKYSYSFDIKKHKFYFKVILTIDGVTNTYTVSKNKIKTHYIFNLIDPYNLLFPHIKTGSLSYYMIGGTSVHRINFLESSIQTMNIDIIQLILNAGVNEGVNKSFYDGDFLELATDLGRSDVVKLLLEYGAGSNKLSK